MAQQYHKVQGCEYLSQIAAKYGFTDVNTIWNHPKNAALKAKRKYHNVLNPGDILFIPDKGEKVEARNTAQTHNFTVRSETIPLKIKVKNVDDKPVVSAKCTLLFGGDVSLVTSDGDGVLTKEKLAITAKDGELGVNSPSLPFGKWDVTLHVGCLDSEDTRAGQQARLNNLGYFAGYSQDNDAQFKWAVEEFQCDHMGPKSATGVCDPKTQARLVEIHGC